MTDKLPFDLDAAFAALERDERAGRPKPSQALVARVLGDAAQIGAALAVAPLTRPARSSGKPGWLRHFGFTDAWAGAAVAATLLVLVAGFGAGYEAGPQLLADTGLDAAFGGDGMMFADAGEVLFDPDDVL